MEIRPFGRIEIGVADISAANDHRAAIGNPGLVMHAAIDTAKAQQKFHAAMEHVLPRPGGVEQAKFDVGMAVDGVENSV